MFAELNSAFAESYRLIIPDRSRKGKRIYTILSIAVTKMQENNKSKPHSNLLTTN